MFPLQWFTLRFILPNLIIFKLPVSITRNIKPICSHLFKNADDDGVTDSYESR